MTSLVAVLTLICVRYIPLKAFHIELIFSISTQVFVMADNYIFLAIDAVLYKGKLRTEYFLTTLSLIRIFLPVYSNSLLASFNGRLLHGAEQARNPDEPENDQSDDVFFTTLNVRTWPSWFRADTHHSTDMETARTLSTSEREAK